MRKVEAEDGDALIRNAARFAGVVGADFLLDALQAQLTTRKPLGTGRFFLLSHRGIYATHPNPARIGLPANDLSHSLLQAVRRGEPVQESAEGQVRLVHPVPAGAGQPWVLLLRFTLDVAARG